MQLAERTEYKDITEYVAAFGLGFIFVLNFIALSGLTPYAPTISKPYLVVLMFVVTIYLNVKYYRLNKDMLHKLSNDLKATSRPNMTSSELLGIILLIEAPTSIFIAMSIKGKL